MPTIRSKDGVREAHVPVRDKGESLDIYLHNILHFRWLCHMSGNIIRH